MIKEYLPPACYSKNRMKSVDGAVIHYISAKNVTPNDPFNREAIINILRGYGFSYNYLIERDGTIIQLVPDTHKAYHAGKSIMNDKEGCNSFTFGIALAGGSAWKYPDEQIIALGKLIIQFMTEHKFTSKWVKGHDEVRENWNEKYPDKAKDKKYDPGDHFPWNILKDMIDGVSMQIKYESQLGEQDGRE